jgi:D-xylonolactonase
MDFEVIASGFGFCEAPLVDDAGNVYFSDLLAGGYHRVRPGGRPEQVLAERIWIGGAAANDDGTIVLGGKGGLVRLDPATGRTTPLLSALEGQPIVAVNDIEPDGRGGLYGGTIDFDAILVRGDAPEPGKLFHLSPEGRVTVLRDDVVASNGLAYSPDGRTLYHSESTVGVWAYPIGADGLPGPGRVFAPHDDCDGLVVDEAGRIWVAFWARAEILRYRDDGTLDATIRLPYPHVISMAFGALDRRDVYVIVGGNAKQPGVGGVVRIRSDVPGLRPGKTRFR